MKNPSFFKEGCRKLLVKGKKSICGGGGVCFLIYFCASLHNDLFSG